MKLLAINGNDLYVTKQKVTEEKIEYEWKKCQSVYQARYSSIVTELSIEPDLNKIYDIYIIPTLTQDKLLYNLFGYQFLFCLGSGDTSQKRIILRDTGFAPKAAGSILSKDAASFSKYFIVQWDKDTQKLSITTENLEIVSFRYRCISSEIKNNFYGNKKFSFLTVDSKNRGIVTGIGTNTNEVMFNFIPSGETARFFKIKNINANQYEINIENDDQKLYMFYVQYQGISTDTYSPISYFTFSHASMIDPYYNKEYGIVSFKTPPRQLITDENNNITSYTYDLDVEYQPLVKKLIIKSANNKNISSIAYSYYVI